MLSKKTKSGLIALAVVAAIGQGTLQRTVIFPKWSKDFSIGKFESGGISPDQLLFAMAGFREMIAGILWVRADAFFDQGNYDAILPIIRLVTALDPGEIDVYATGMWHIGYNFTDEEQRSDRRYIPSAIALGKDGYRKNPDTYELYFETGWLWYHKIDDYYDNAVRLFTEAQTKPDIQPARRNLLAMALQRNGEPEKALDKYLELYERAKKNYEADSSFGNRQNMETIEGNVDTTFVRLVQRGWVAKEQGRSTDGYDNSPPHDVGFSAKVTVPEANILRIEGSWNVKPVGTRVRVVLRDENMEHATTGGFDWDYSKDVYLDPPKLATMMQDQLFVKNRRFNRKVDMSKDPTMYPFIQDNYVIEFYYNPRSAPPHIQDKFSWDGSGMTDKNYLNTEIRPGQRVVFASLKISRDMIRRMGEWRDKVPVCKTPNYLESNRVTGLNGEDVVLDIPSLRSSIGSK